MQILQARRSLLLQLPGQRRSRLRSYNPAQGAAASLPARGAIREALTSSLPSGEAHVRLWNNRPSKMPR